MTSPSRSPSWKWWVSGLLLSATMINYMDRVTLANLSVRVTFALGLSQQQYGNLEFAFGWAFAFGSLFFGFLVDYMSVRWLYPCVLLGWSIAGIMTGLTSTYEELLICRTVLGLFEAGHWPCALATVQRIMDAKNRHFANSMLQSGAALGAILTPPIILAIIRSFDPGEMDRLAHQALGGGMASAATGPAPQVWPIPFIIVGAIGSLWIVAWFILIRRHDLPYRPNTTVSNEPRFAWIVTMITDRRFWVLLLMVTALNTTWQTIRAWLPKYLQEGRGYPEAEALWVNSAFYVAADIGCLISGAIGMRLAKRGFEVHSVRIGVYGISTLITSLAVTLAWIPNGWFLIAMILFIGAGALSLFPCYYSFTQEFSSAHIGRISGLLAAMGWFISSPLQRVYGGHIDKTHSFELGIALSGLAPAIGLIALLLLWRRNSKS